MIVRLVLAALLALTGVARAADAERDAARLRGRLAPETIERVLEVAAGARDAGLPTDPLVSRALEGASRRASADDIVADVRRHAVALGGARTALGTTARSVEIEAGAAALLAGVPADSLARLRDARRAGSLAISLVVMCDLVSRGVPADAASGSVIRAARAGARDEMMLELRERVHERIGRGASPAGATRESVEQLLGRRLNRQAPKKGAIP